MGTRKLDLSSAPINYERTVERFYRAAFGPSPAWYRKISLCGWRPLSDSRRNEPSSALARARRDAGELPGIEVYETAEGMTIEVALSAIREESLHLAVSGEKVIIRGERILRGRDGKGFPAGEQAEPRFRHSIALPETISPGGFRVQMKGDIVRIDFIKRHR